MIVFFIPAFIVVLLGFLHIIPENILEILMLIFGLGPAAIMMFYWYIGHPIAAAFKERKETGRFGSSLFVALLFTGIACVTIVLCLLDELNH